MRIKRRDLKRLIRESIEPESVKTKAFEEFSSLKPGDIDLLNNFLKSISKVLDLNDIFGVEGYEVGLSKSELALFNESKTQLSGFIKTFLSSKSGEDVTEESITDYIESIFLEIVVTYRGNTNKVLANSWYKNGKYHRGNDKPAYVFYNDDGSISAELWFKDGKKHRDNDKPAVIDYREDGSVESKSWCKEGEFHRDNDMPAYITYYKDSSVRSEQWYKDGKSHRDNDKPAAIRYYENGSVKKERWFKNGIEYTPERK